MLAKAAPKDRLGKYRGSGLAVTHPAVFPLGKASRQYVSVSRLTDIRHSIIQTFKAFEIRSSEAPLETFVINPRVV
jgi:hypothetical protein